MSAHHDGNSHVLSALVATFAAIGGSPWRVVAGDIAEHVGFGLGAGLATYTITHLVTWAKRRLFKGEKK
jgi:hypothetical protein